MRPTTSDKARARPPKTQPDVCCRWKAGRASPLALVIVAFIMVAFYLITKAVQ